MLFAPDTEVALRSVVNLINTAANGAESLVTMEDLDSFLEAEEFTGSRVNTPAELSSIKRLRSELAALWSADEDTAAKSVNKLLADAKALPQLVKHDHWDWHLHATTRKHRWQSEWEPKLPWPSSTSSAARKWTACACARRTTATPSCWTSAATVPSSTAIQGTALTAPTLLRIARGRPPRASDKGRRAAYSGGNVARSISV